MTGHAMPWNKDLSGQQKEDQKNARELQKDQLDLEKQQKREIEQRRKKLNVQQISMLRARFGVSGGGGNVMGGAAGAAQGASTGMQTMQDTASSLFARITGR